MRGLCLELLLSRAFVSLAITCTPLNKVAKVSQDKFEAYANSQAEEEKFKTQSQYAMA